MTNTEEDEEGYRLYIEALVCSGDAYLELMLHEDAQLFRVRHEEDAALPTVYPRLSADDVYGHNDTIELTPSGFGEEHQKEGSRDRQSRHIARVPPRASSID